jgi:hypothetical protein
MKMVRRWRPDGGLLHLGMTEHRAHQDVVWVTPQPLGVVRSAKN